MLAEAKHPKVSAFRTLDQFADT